MTWGVTGDIPLHPKLELELEREKEGERERGSVNSLGIPSGLPSSSWYSLGQP